jgi:hypothetical protein
MKVSVYIAFSFCCGLVTSIFFIGRDEEAVIPAASGL